MTETMTEAVYDVVPEGTEAVSVRGAVVIKGSTKSRSEAADFGAYITYTLTATQAPQQVLPYDENRKTATILCTGTGPVLLGSQAQTMASPALGYTLPTGVSLTVTHKQQVWLVPDGTHTATVSVAVERWTSPLTDDPRTGVPGIAEE